MVASTAVPRPSDRRTRSRPLDRPLARCGSSRRETAHVGSACDTAHTSAPEMSITPYGRLLMPSVAYPVAHRERRINQTFPSYKHACMGRVFWTGCV